MKLNPANRIKRLSQDAPMPTIIISVTLPLYRLFSYFSAPGTHTICCTLFPTIIIYSLNSVTTITLLPHIMHESHMKRQARVRSRAHYHADAFTAKNFQDRKSDVEGTSVSVRVDLDGSRTNKKKN